MNRLCFRGHFKFRSLDGIKMFDCTYDHFSLEFLKNDCMQELLNRYPDCELISDWYEFLEPNYVH